VKTIVILATLALAVAACGWGPDRCSEFDADIHSLGTQESCSKDGSSIVTRQMTCSQEKGVYATSTTSTRCDEGESCVQTSTYAATCQR
jgi:hypothetical protein